MKDRVKKLLELNKERIEYLRELSKGGIEGNFVICKNGEGSMIIVGEHDKVKTGTTFENFCRMMNSEIFIDIHNHPSGIKMPTIADMVNVAQSSGPDALVCVVTDDDITCAKPEGEAVKFANKLKGKSKFDENFYKLYSEYAKSLSTYGWRWRSFDPVDKNVKILKFKL